MRFVVVALAAVGCAAPATNGVEPTSAPHSSQAEADPFDALPRDVHAPDPVDDKPAATVVVRAVRDGNLLYVRVVGHAADRRADTSFEDLRRWVVEAEVAGVPLKRVVNGASTVRRARTTKPRRFDVTIAFDTTFRLPSALARDAAQAEVNAYPPEERLVLIPPEVPRGVAAQQDPDASPPSVTGGVLSESSP